MSFMAASSHLPDGVGQDGQHPAALDGGGHLALVLGAVPADPARDDLAALGQEVLHLVLVLVVDLEVLVGAEAAHLPPPEPAPAALLAAAIVPLAIAIAAITAAAASATAAEARAEATAHLPTAHVRSCHG